MPYFDDFKTGTERMEPSKKPLNLLTRTLNNNVQVRLKNDLEYKGNMVQCDAYMNLILENAIEYRNDAPAANYGNIFVRGNNILYIAIRK